MTADTIPTDTLTAADRMAAALHDPSTMYTADQVAWIIQLDREARGDDPADPGFRDLVWRSGYDEGYRARCAEENQTYRNQILEAEQDSGLRTLIETVDARRAADRAARLPRPGDFPGGYPLPPKES